MAAVNTVMRRTWRAPPRAARHQTNNQSSVMLDQDAEPPRKRLKLFTGDNKAGQSTAEPNGQISLDSDPLPLDPALGPHDSVMADKDHDRTANNDDNDNVPQSDDPMLLTSEAPFEEADNNNDRDYEEEPTPRLASDDPFDKEELNQSRPRSARARPSRPRRDTDRAPRFARRPAAASSPKPRYSTAAAATAATQAHDSYKPREERSWEEFHPDLNLFAHLPVLTAEEVDGTSKQPTPPSIQPPPPLPPPPLSTAPSTTASIFDDEFELVSDVLPPPSSAKASKPSTPITETASRRGRGRPRANADSMLNGLGSTPVPKIVPLPTHNPKERLNLPKPSFRSADTTANQEATDKEHPEDYVDRAMANVGYQESERFHLPRGVLIRHVDSSYDDSMSGGLILESDHPGDNPPPPPQIGHVEYDMDEQDGKWLEDHNHRRKEEQTEPIKPAIFEVTMTQIEREFSALEKRIPKQNARHTASTRPRSDSAAAVNGEALGTGEEPDSKCAICDDGDCENANAIIFCDGCDLAVHQECYGVPFIPEGQWFCRKCKEVGRGTPTCIFCPNIDGAFKQTNTLRWSHLLCAIWIPEVTIANPTFMDTIQDVDRVPRSRWGLICYICNQRMGACIQCSKKACYQAFHVTCARRARLFLKMKSSPTSGLDASVLKALCDKHVPHDWRRENDVDNAIVSAKRHYRKTFKHCKWVDSRSVAVPGDTPAFSALPQIQDQDMHHPREQRPGRDEDNITASAKKKKKDQPTTGWKLASGAPVVPQVVFNAVETALARFTVRKRKEFTAEMCKYWTLKREARRGAALLKRLQLQLESFSSMEITRKNFSAMGAAGRSKLTRRIEFAELLEIDMDRLQDIVQSIAQREQKKLHDADHLQHLFDSVYFPLSGLLWPILRKAQKLGEKSTVFEHAFAEIENKLSERYYISVVPFSYDLAASLAPASDDAPNTEYRGPRDIRSIFNSLNKGPITWAERQRLALSHEGKETKALAKRIVRAVHPMIEAVLNQEAELKGVTADSLVGSDYLRIEANEVPNGVEQVDPEVPADTAIPSIESGVEEIVEPKNEESRPDVVSDGAEVKQSLSDDVTGGDQPANHVTNHVSTVSLAPRVQQVHDPWSNGGVPQYLNLFDIEGTTMYQERWPGRDQVRAMSEALTELDDDTMQELEHSASIERDEQAVSGGSELLGKSKSTPRTSRSSARTRSRPSRGRKPTNDVAESEAETELEDGIGHAKHENESENESDKEQPQAIVNCNSGRQKREGTASIAKRRTQRRRTGG